MAGHDTRIGAVITAGTDSRAGRLRHAGLGIAELGSIGLRADLLTKFDKTLVRGLKTSVYTGYAEVELEDKSKHLVLKYPHAACSKGGAGQSHVADPASAASPMRLEQYYLAHVWCPSGSVGTGLPDHILLPVGRDMEGRILLGTLRHLLTVSTARHGRQWEGCEQGNIV